MPSQFKNTGALLFLVALAYLAFQIGSTLEMALKIFAVFIWVGVIAMAVFLTLFRGMRFSMFGRGRDVDDGEVAGEFEDDDLEGEAPGDGAPRGEPPRLEVVKSE